MAEIASGSIDLKSLKVAGEANKYITAIDENGVKVHAANNINLNYTQITSEGMEVFKTNGATSNPSAISVAKFGQTSIIGRQDQSHIKIINNGLSILNSGITLFDLLLNENQQAKLQHKYDFGETVFVPAGPGPYDVDSYSTTYPIVTVDNTTFSTDVEFEELKNAIDSFTINGYMGYYNLSHKRISFSVQFDVAATATETIGQEYVLKPGHEEETPTEQNTILITIYGRHIANSNSVTFYTDSNNELPSSIDLLLLYNLKCYKMTGLPVLTLGLKDRSHVEIDYHSLKLIDQEGESYLYISDLRDMDGYANVHEFCIVNESFLAYPFYSTILSATVDSVYKVTIDDVETSDYTVRIQSGTTDHVTVELTTPPTIGSKVAIFYHSNDIRAKAFTLGKRNFHVSNSTAPYSFAMGYEVMAEGTYSHAIGYYTKAFGRGAHAEGGDTEAQGNNSHAEGVLSKAIGPNAHAEGQDTIASGAASHAEGSSSEARGDYSHASGSHTVANKAFQTAIGKYNIIDTYTSTSGADKGQYAFIIGNGGTGGIRSNALTVDWNGSISSYINYDTDSTYNTDASGTTEEHYLTQFAVINSNNNKTAYIDVHKWSYGESLAVFGMQRMFNGANNTSETIQNQFGLGVKSDKSLYIWIPDNAKGAWRDALGFSKSQATPTKTNNSVWISGSIELIKVGQMVTVKFNGVNFGATSTRTSFATIPEAYRPLTETGGMFDSSTIWFFVRPDGSIAINQAASGQRWGAVTYIVQF